MIATTLFAPIRSAKILVVIVAAIVAGIVAGKIVARKIVVAKLRLSNGCGFAGRGAEIRQNGLVLNLALAQGGQIVGDGFFFVEPDQAGIGAHETFIKNAAGKLVKAFVFEGAQHASADFRGVGDGIEREAALLALFAKFFSEGAHTLLLLGFRPHRDAIIIGEGWDGRHQRVGVRRYLG